MFVVRPRSHSRGLRSAPVEAAGGDPGQATRLVEHHEFAANPDAVPAARHAAAAAAARVGEPLAETVAMLVSELVTNAVEHSGASPQTTIAMDLRETADSLRIEVSDGGRGFDPPFGAPPDEEPRGRGLLLVQLLADSWGVSANPSTRVWFELSTNNGREAASA